MNTLFQPVNDELIKIKQWFSANKLSVRSILSPVPALKINNCGIERVYTTKILGALLDGNLSWEEHIKYLM